MIERAMCNQDFINNEMALNIFTMQNKIHAILFDNFKSKSKDIRVVESSYEYCIYFQQNSLPPQGNYKQQI